MGGLFLPTNLCYGMMILVMVLSDYVGVNDGYVVLDNNDGIFGSRTSVVHNGKFYVIRLPP